MSNLNPSSDDTISEQEAIDITTNYRDYISNIDPQPNYIRAFNIPMVDIQELAAGFPKCPSVRAYLCMAVAGDVTTLKIVLVPVDANNKDILTVPVEISGAMIDQSSIYDFTSPCPQTCDIDSPLFS
jgi:hypothetical protein